MYWHRRFLNWLRPPPVPPPGPAPIPPPEPAPEPPQFGCDVCENLTLSKRSQPRCMCNLCGSLTGLEYSHCDCCNFDLCEFCYKIRSCFSRARRFFLKLWQQVCGYVSERLPHRKYFLIALLILLLLLIITPFISCPALPALIYHIDQSNSDSLFLNRDPHWVSTNRRFEMVGQCGARSAFDKAFNDWYNSTSPDVSNIHIMTGFSSSAKKSYALHRISETFANHWCPPLTIVYHVKKFQSADFLKSDAIILRNLIRSHQVFLIFLFDEVSEVLNDRLMLELLKSSRIFSIFSIDTDINYELQLFKQTFKLVPEGTLINDLDFESHLNKQSKLFWSNKWLNQASAFTYSHFRVLTNKEKAKILRQTRPMLVSNFPEDDLIKLVRNSSLLRQGDLLPLVTQLMHQSPSKIDFPNQNNLRDNLVSALSTVVDLADSR